MLAYISLFYQVFFCLALFLDILIGNPVSLIVWGMREKQSDGTEMLGLGFFVVAVCIKVNYLW